MTDLLARSVGQKRAGRAGDWRQDTEALEAWRVRYLSRKGALTAGDEGAGHAAARGASGLRAGGQRGQSGAGSGFRGTAGGAEGAALEAELTAGTVDVTLPGRPPALGHLHITTQTLRQLYAIFAEMGFQVYDAPDVETDDYNFGLLNIPPYHPARDMWDTFWVSQDAEPRPGASGRWCCARTPAPARFAPCASAARSRSA